MDSVDLLIMYKVDFLLFLIFDLLRPRTSTAVEVSRKEQKANHLRLPNNT